MAALRKEEVEDLHLGCGCKGGYVRDRVRFDLLVTLGLGLGLGLEEVFVIDSKSELGLGLGHLRGDDLLSATPSDILDKVI